MTQTGSGRQQVVMRDANLPCDLVGGFETDALDLAGGAVGLGGQDAFGLGAKVFYQLQALGRRDAVGLEKNGEFALRTFGVPRLLDSGGAFFPDALDIAEPAGFLAEDAQGIGAETIDNFIGVDLTDAWDEAAAEVFADTIHAGGQFAAEVGDFELGAVLGVVRPFAGEVEGLAAFDARQSADDRDGIGPTFGVSWRRGANGGGGIGPEFRDGVVVFLVEENDPLNDTGERGGRKAGGGGHG